MNGTTQDWVAAEAVCMLRILAWVYMQRMTIYFMKKDKVTAEELIKI
jgi:hypothetical protein